MPARVVLATASAGKVAECTALLREWGEIEVHSLAEFPDVRLPPETGVSYAENAIAKARAVAVTTGLPALGDDSGLEVEVLGGTPGIHSARYAPTDAERIARLLAALADVPAAGRRARFRCVIALVWPGGRTETAEGRCDGSIAAAPSGSQGFGYDPVFVADELGRTFAEATPDEKARVSHRARSIRALGDRLAAGRRTSLRGCAGPC